MGLSLTTEFFVRILAGLLSVVSKPIKALLDELIRNLYEKAQQTSNDVDDIFVEFLADLLHIDLD